MSDYVSEKIEQYECKLKQAEKAGKHNKAKKYQEKLERLRAEAAEQSTDSDTDSDDDVDSDDEADNSFALDEEPDVAPRGLKGASKLEWLGGRGAKKLVANACREAVSEGGARDGFNANSAIRILLPDHLKAMWKWIDKLGFGDKLQKFLVKMNRAAEASAKKAFQTFANAILGLDFGNARALATSSEPDAISSWLEKTCHGDLLTHFSEIVREKIKDVTYYWKKLKRYWNKADKLALDAVPDFDDVASVSKSMVTRGFAPTDHVVTKGLDGLFALARKAEAAMRAKVGEVADRLIQAVFAPFKNFFSLVKQWRPLKREIDDGAKVKKNPVTLALRKARKARKRAVKWFAETFDDSEDEAEDEPLGPNMDAHEDMDGDDELENGAYTFSLKDDGTGVVAKQGVDVWTTAELDFDPYSEGATTGGKVFRMRDGMLVLESEDGTELWTYGEDGGPATTLVLSADGGLSLTDDEFTPIEVLFEGADDE